VPQSRKRSRSRLSFFSPEFALCRFVVPEPGKSVPPVSVQVTGPNRSGFFSPRTLHFSAARNIGYYLPRGDFRTQ
jgi:hypothetical protein